MLVPTPAASLTTTLKDTGKIKLALGFAVGGSNYRYINCNKVTNTPLFADNETELQLL